MDYLQYYTEGSLIIGILSISFKPYYKWITFNTVEVKENRINASFEF